MADGQPILFARMIQRQPRFDQGADLSEKNKIEDFMSQVRYLEREVEELEKERTQLRARLRDALTKQGKGEEGLKIQKGDEYLRTNKDLRD